MMIILAVAYSDENLLNADLCAITAPWRCTIEHARINVNRLFNKLASCRSRLWAVREIIANTHQLIVALSHRDSWLMTSQCATLKSMWIKRYAYSSSSSSSMRWMLSVIDCQPSRLAQSRNIRDILAYELKMNCTRYICIGLRRIGDLYMSLNEMY